MIKLQAVWAVLSSVWEKALPFVIKHWKLILIVALSVALFLKMRADYKAMETAYEARLESSEAQLEGLKEIHKVQMREMEVLMDAMLADLERIEEERDRARADLEERHEERVDEIEREWREHPEGVAEQIEGVFGFEYVE
mgnify:CR=1 FL=1|tara:strand:- start:400 stop:819 length:420 start_codon:yes stop_codon:yes gene_type:complete